VADASSDAVFDQWVKPFYLLQRNPKARNDVQRSYAKLSPSITPKTVDSLLEESDWRFRITGAFFASIRSWSQFDKQIGDLLQSSSDSKTTNAYLHALVRFNSSKSETCICSKLDSKMMRSKCIGGQFKPETIALAFIDALNGSNLSTAYRDKVFLVDNSELEEKWSALLARFEDQHRFIIELASLDRNHDHSNQRKKDPDG